MQEKLFKVKFLIRILLCHILKMSTQIGSKKAVRWLFGFTEIKQELEVKLSHSLVTGKKVLVADTSIHNDIHLI